MRFFARPELVEGFERKKR